MLSFAPRERLLCQPGNKRLCYEIHAETDSFGRYSLMTGFRRLGSPLYSLSICGGFPYPSLRRSPDRKTLSPSRHWTRFPSFPESARTAALSPFHNVCAVAHEFKFEWPFEVPHALFDRERGG
ncbi:hypothetical protein Tco_1374648, partial [Tanacetum coccineum]